MYFSKLMNEGNFGGMGPLSSRGFGKSRFGQNNFDTPNTKPTKFSKGVERVIRKGAEGAVRTTVDTAKTTGRFAKGMATKPLETTGKAIKGTAAAALGTVERGIKAVPKAVKGTGQMITGKGDLGRIGGALKVGGALADAGNVLSPRAAARSIASGVKYAAGPSGTKGTAGKASDASTGTKPTASGPKRVTDPNSQAARNLKATNPDLYAKAFGIKKESHIPTFKEFYNERQR